MAKTPSSTSGIGDYSGPGARKPRSRPAPAPAPPAAIPAALHEAIPPAYAGMRLDQALARLFPQYSRSRLQAWLKDGCLLVDEGPAAARRTVHGGERVVLAPPAPRTEVTGAAQAIALTIAHEDRDILVIDKPAGLVVHPGAGNPDGTLMNALLAHDAALAGLPRAGIVHRLDKDTSGLLVVAKTLEAQASLTRQLQARTMARTYTALAWGMVRVGSGLIDAPIGRDARSRTRMAVTQRGKPARTAYRVLERLRGMTLLECNLESGRTHQIRVHLQSIGHPVVGDPVYRRRAGGAAIGEFRRQALHATRLELVHPRSGKTVHWGSKLPADFLNLLQRLRDVPAA